MKQVFSGGFGNFTQGVFTKPEADSFAEVAIQMGIFTFFSFFLLSSVLSTLFYFIYFIYL